MSSSSAERGFLKRDGRLYRLILEHFPDHRSKQGVLDIPRLCHEMGFANETIYRCVRNDEMKPAVALRFLKYSHENHPENPLFWQHLLPFALPEFERFNKDHDPAPDRHAEADAEDLDDLL